MLGPSPRRCARLLTLAVHRLIFPFDFRPHQSHVCRANRASTGSINMARVQRRGRLTDTYLEGLTKPGFYRDGLLPGFGVRIGCRRRSFELRIERKGREKVFQTLGAWPTTKTDEARAQAHDILARYERKESIKEPRHGEMTIALAWPLYRARLIDDGASPSTLDGYKFAYARLSEEIRNTPLRDLAANPVLMADEIEAIRKRLH